MVLDNFIKEYSSTISISIFFLEVLILNNYKNQNINKKLFLNLDQL